MEKIATLSLSISPQDSNEERGRWAFSLGPMLQSVLMERLDDSYAAQLHASTFNPYSQYCFMDDNGEVVWCISSLTGEATDRIVGPVSGIESFVLRNLNKEFVVSGKRIETFEIDRLLEVLKGDAPSTFRVRLVSPTAFRSGGRYAFFPDVRLIFQNLLMRYNQVYGGDAEVDTDTLKYITEHVFVTSYNLRSHYFSRTMSSESKIPAFLGEFTLRVRGPQSLRGLVAMLLAFGELSGLGVKTSMGMGGLKLIGEKPMQKGGRIGR